MSYGFHIVMFPFPLTEVGGFRVMVFDATFNNISVIFCQSVLINGGNWSNYRKSPICRKPLASFITYYYITINILDSDGQNITSISISKCDDHRSKVHARLTLLLNTAACTQK